MFRVDKANLNGVYIGLVFLVCYIILAVIATRPIFSYDVFWHLQMGQDLLEKGLSPWVDHYSFSFYGNEISTVPVMFQLLVAKFTSLFGEDKGLYFVKLLYVSILMLVLYVYFRKIKANWLVVFILLPAFVYFIHLRLMLRPDVFSNVLVVLCLVLYLKAQKTFANKELALICLLLLFWVNYHSPIIGYIVIFGLFIDKAINKYYKGDESFTWAYWLLWGGIIFLIGFIRPSGQHFLVTVFSLLTEDFAKYTNEYRASYPTFSKDIVINASWMLSTYVVVWSLLKRQFGFALIAVLLTYYSWTTIRLITVAMLVNFCILALYVSEFYISHHKDKIRRSVKVSLLFVAVAISLFTYYKILSQANISINSNSNKEKILEKRYPVQVADYMNRYQDGGNILNRMSAGGYLLNHLNADYKIYIDGRTNILYPADFLKYSLELVGNSEELNKTIESHNVKYALFSNTPDVYAALKKNNTLKLNYADSNFLLFSEEKEFAFPLSSLLMVFPFCWNDVLAENMLNEIELSEALLSEDSYEINIVQAFMKKYLSAENKQAFFADLKVEDLQVDSIRRIASYLALKAGANKKSTFIFESILDINDYDFLLRIHYLALNQQYESAENLLYYFYTIVKYVDKRIIEFDKIAIMVQVLDILERNSELMKFEVSYKAELEEKLRKANFSIDDAMSFESICK